jgi:hypothetical protein
LSSWAQRTDRKIPSLRPLFCRGTPCGCPVSGRRKTRVTHKGCPYNARQMSYDPDIHHRRSIRLREYDYSQPGAYYVTICVQDHQCLLGEVVQGQMNHNDAGRMVDRDWRSIPTQFPAVELDECIVMPNHFHGILRIVGAPVVGGPDPDVSKQRADVGAPLVGARESAPYSPRSRVTHKGCPYVRRNGWGFQIRHHRSVHPRRARTGLARLHPKALAPQFLRAYHSQ